MRISTAQFYETSSANYTRTYANVIKTGEEVASQIKLNSAADDPVGAARVLQLAQQNAMLTQYKSNISTVTTSVAKSETALSSIGDALQRVSELLVSAGNGTYTDKDRQASADELEELQKQILSLMNSKGADGQYLFSGSKSSTPPYSQNSDGTYSYDGDQSLIKLAIGDGLSIASNTTGWDAFETAVNTTRTSATLTSPATDDGKISLSGGVVTTASKYNSEYVSGQPYKLTFLSSTEYKITDANDVDVTADAGGTGVFSSADASAQVISFRGVDLSLNVNLTTAERATTAAADAALAGREFALTTTPDKISTTRSPGNTSNAVITGAAVGTSSQDLEDYNNSFPAGGAIIKFTSDTEYDLYASPLTSTSTKISSGTIGTPATSSSGISFTVSGTPVVGDTFVVNGGTQQTQNVLNTLNSVITALTTPADGDPVATQKLQAALDSALGNISSGSERVSNAISEGGARQAATVSQGTTNDLLQGNNTVEQGKIVDSDPVDAIGRLTMQQTMLTASQLVFTRVSQLNLFSKL
ncbi:MAG TPA: flagellar hook-associated protein 3 [Pseudomonas sp.]|jgi:flagellar hook-associated protein 3 FlgL|uniref:flagellar hook-associated protein 3 n=1 Tax=Pseudomonas sp. TaxID=306 RepID=UPI002EDB4613